VGGGRRHAQGVVTPTAASGLFRIIVLIRINNQRTVGRCTAVEKSRSWSYPHQALSVTWALAVARFFRSKGRAVPYFTTFHFLTFQLLHNTLSLSQPPLFTGLNQQAFGSIHPSHYLRRLFFFTKV